MTFARFPKGTPACVRCDTAGGRIDIDDVERHLQRLEEVLFPALTAPQSIGGRVRKPRFAGARSSYFDDVAESICQVIPLKPIPRVGEYYSLCIHSMNSCQDT